VTEAELRQVAGELAGSARELAALGWAPATSGNFSMRLDRAHVAITASGRNKARLSETDILVVDLDGRPLATGAAADLGLEPSAETPLHTQLYRRDAGIGCVLHTHSRVQTVASRVFAARGAVRFHGYELVKAFAGMTSHETAVELPIVPNSQDIAALAERTAALFLRGPRWGYLIEGHGLYAWGRNMSEARRHLEAFEFLLACELDMRSPP